MQIQHVWLPLLLLVCSCNRHLNHPSKMAHFTIPFESNPNQTLTYHEAIACYEKMAAAYPDIFKLSTVGSTDSGYPLHVAVLNTSGIFEPEAIRKSGKRILLINNGIHPGEPEGIDATIMLLRDYLEKKELQKALEHLVLVVIPVYNIDGCLNRGSYSRANQDGPEAYGFRGNARNYDLNRDFIKCDSRNARSFNQIFTTWMPDIFVDNHTSNGADYQYTMTLIATQHNKLEAPLGTFLENTMLPELYADMKSRKWEMIPYVDSPKETPDSGIVGFCDYGRYSTGYAALWNTIGFMPETHMLKPFKDRVWSTYHFMDVVVQFMSRHIPEIRDARAKAWDNTRTKKAFVLDYAMDQHKQDMITFKGFEAKYKPSEVSGLPRLWYDRNAPYEKQIPYYNHFVPQITVDKPEAYIIPQAWENVIERLKINGVEMKPLSRDVDVEAETYFIRDFKTRNGWEGHYFHHGVTLEKKTMTRHFQKGDLVILTNQQANRYLLETLEPNAPDSWFAWNFFEPVLMQKEYFSAYVFEDLAAQFLKENPAVKVELDAKRAAEPDFAADAAQQLDWVYRKSPWYEPTHRMYPVARVNQVTNLPVE
ncbi:MAG: M14 family metallopeptidase [Chitinophagales bacterium]|nr:M14 family metallopeptidase [Chitinophagales bacterium]